jgi:hypothetical protein
VPRDHRRERLEHDFDALRRAEQPEGQHDGPTGFDHGRLGAAVVHPGCVRDAVMDHRHLVRRDRVRLVEEPDRLVCEHHQPVGPIGDAPRRIALRR